ncbi:TonB-dependent receptor [Mesorhizobium sp. M00.F.Ca.ET.151.01.1.1]|nr:TonB-dependent receptor [bacterium M00.F.Ca.ET.199.01.1.1]TGS97104.1 TonB-dependent receptor [bacterium M00.F.Ca.ET.177.01.1.1]TGT62954.1 TonB-dependent receptor [Mesorhizobium sp. M00.F.Ca.ET.170.01.1.1]TGU13942.1 TonB-dependent receptor [bacterium M00.F.Ca.ET.163.01.1.1]TGU95845.1 TonB-dependent receptor [Mesorhizobium sp. M00.F.Ca.ET.151.01.1.1]TGV58983.1 TonB-dependent receptor [bacterium M00.F.Ca.ET.141.01.1.1]
MTYITSRKHAPRVSLLATATLAAGFAPLAAQAADSADAGSRNATELDKVQVRGSWFNPSSPKFTAELLDTPKSVSIVSEKLIAETGATNLQDALRMVPGITFGAGEGGNPTGDRPFIRGFDSQSNVFVDGLRDVGSQTREIFDLEQVEVVKGPSSAYGGRDSGGGSLNLVSKTPKLKNETSASMGIGTDSYARGTVDANYVLGDGIAARLNLMKHESDIAGRDAANVSRWGIAPSIAFGLNGPAQLIASHYHMQSDDLPDAGGFPYGNPSGAPASKWVDGRPMVPDRNNYYGLVDRDFQRTRADISTLDASYDFGGHKLRNIARLGNTSNDYLWTQPDDSQGNPNNYGTLWRRTNSRAVDVKSFADQLGLTGAFQTGVLKHSYSAGVEYSDEKMTRGSYLMTPGTSNPLTGNSKCPTTGAATGYNCTDFANPNPRDPWAATHSVYRSDKALDVEQRTKTTSAYVFDTIELNEQWMINLGLRYDDFRTTLTTPVAGAAPTRVRNSNDFLNYQAGVVFKPAANGSIYLSWGTSSTPPGMDGGDGSDGLSAAVADLKPQDTKNLELGTKWDLFDQRLNLTAAIFHTVMNNARVTVDNGTSQNAGKKEINGFELGFTGQLTEAWSLYGGYTYLDSELKDNGFVCGAPVGRTCPSNVYVPSPYNGNEFPNTAKHSANLWTTYRFPIGLTLGAGAFYSDKQYGDVANTKWIASYTRFDAMASYAIQDNISLQLNVQNLTDKTYFTKAYASHYASIAPGRSATLALNVKF